MRTFFSSQWHLLKQKVAVIASVARQSPDVCYRSSRDCFVPRNDGITTRLSKIRTIVFRLIQQVFLCSSILLNSPSVFASHNFAGLDMCALYPEVMPPGLKPEQLPEAGGLGATLMDNYCTQCHELPGPGRHTAEEWPSVLDRMLVIMDVADRFGGLLGNVKTPSPDERDQLRSYLVTHALKPLLQKPHGTGASAFENHCGTCHVLPDPAQYDIDWSELIKKMQRNMQVMKYSPPTADSMMQIQLYLQNSSADDNNHISAGHHNSDQLNLNMAGDSIRFKNKKLNQEKLNMGSWLSLGVFFLLAFIGLLRGWNSHHQSRLKG